MSLDLIRRLVKGSPLNAADHDSNLDELESRRIPDNWMVIHAVEDLPDPVGDQVTLPPNKTVILSGALNIGSDAIRLSQGTLLRGFGGDSVTSTNASGVIRATNLGANVVMREFSVIAPSGPALSLQGPIDHQLNLFFMGLIGASAGQIEGFDVQALKSCFVNAAAGITHTGTTNKVFVDSTPFYGVTAGNAGIKLAAGLNADVVDLVTNFFKYDAGACVEAVAGHVVGQGRMRGNLIDGAATPLVGLATSDPNWAMHDNSKISDSRAVGELSMDGNTTETVLVQNVWTKVAGTTTASHMERFDMPVSNRLRYTGDRRQLCNVNFSAGVFGTASNQAVQFAFFRNGVIATPPMTMVLSGTGSLRADVVALTSLFEFTAPNDYIEVWMRCTSGSSNATVGSLQLTTQS